MVAFKLKTSKVEIKFMVDERKMMQVYENVLKPYHNDEISFDIAAARASTFLNRRNETIRNV